MYRRRSGEKDHVVPQNRTQEALDMQLDGSETQLINVIESTRHSIDQSTWSFIQDTRMMFASSELANTAC